MDESGIYTGSESVHNPRPGGYDFEVPDPVTGKPMRKPANGYRFPEATFREMETAGIILYGEDENRIVKIKEYLDDYEDSLRSVITLDGRLGSYEMKRLFPETNDPVFTNPKPAELLESLISFASSPDALILDFFAGSGSLGHAVLSLNRKDQGARKFILIQLPEPCDEEKVAASLGLKTIADITKERMRRVANSMNNAHSNQLRLENKQPEDQGFRVFRLAESNFKTWDAAIEKDPQKLEQQLDLHVQHIREERTATDLLYEILPKSGFMLTTTVETENIEGKAICSVAGGMLIICLERQLTMELLRGLQTESRSGSSVWMKDSREMTN